MCWSCIFGIFFGVGIVLVEVLEMVFGVVGNVVYVDVLLVVCDVVCNGVLLYVVM